MNFYNLADRSGRHPGERLNLTLTAKRNSSFGADRSVAAKFGRGSTFVVPRLSATAMNKDASLSGTIVFALLRKDLATAKAVQSLDALRG